MPMVSASGLENVDHVCPTTKRFVWRNACRSRIARPAPAKSLSMNMRIGPLALGMRSSVLRRLAVGEYTVRASSPARGTPTGIEDVTNLSSVPRASRVWTATSRAWPPSLKDEPGTRNTNRPWKISSRDDAGWQIRRRFGSRTTGRLRGWYLSRRQRRRPLRELEARDPVVLVPSALPRRSAAAAPSGRGPAPRSSGPGDRAPRAARQSSAAVRQSPRQSSSVARARNRETPTAHPQPCRAEYAQDRIAEFPSAG